jgi:pectinesterase
LTRKPALRHVTENLSVKMEYRMIRTISVAAAVIFAMAIPLSAAPTIITVDPSGSANFTTVQAAVNSITWTPTSSSPVEIHINPGTYVEQVDVPAARPFVKFIGTDPATTKITFNHGADGTVDTWHSATVYFEASDFSVEGISIENSYGIGLQALALSASGRRGQFKNVRLLANQDTLLFYAGPFYLTNCRIEGTTDFMYGNGTAWFENCEIYSRSGNYLTASNADIAYPYGFVYNNCRLTRASSLGNSTVDLGRPWGDYAAVAYLNCWMDSHIKPTGWSDWGQPARQATVRYYEYNSWGPGGNTSNRVTWPGVHVLKMPADAAVLAGFNMPNVMNVPGVGAWMPSYADTSADHTSPAPDPMTWASVPVASNARTAAMAASMGTDTSGVEYFFENMTDPNHNSGWQASTSYSDTGLNMGVTYTYRVKARDMSVNQNLTAWSATASVTMPVSAMQIEEVLLLPAADARLSADYPNNNYGTYGSFWARNLGSNTLMGTGILRFQLPSDGRLFWKAKLELWNKGNQPAKTVRIFALKDGSAGEAFNETTVTYNNGPGIIPATGAMDVNTVELYSVIGGAAETPCVTPDGTAQNALNNFLGLDTNRIATLYTASSSGAMEFYSKEGGTSDGQRPHLHLWLLNNGCPKTYLADINADCRVNMLDFAIMASQWMGLAGTPPADIIPMGAADGVVNAKDLAQLAADWLSGL